MLTYLQVNVYYTLPPTIALYVLMRPLLGNFVKFKLITFSALAMVHATIWHDYIIHREVLSYGKDAILGTIGHAPIEEYLFFVSQTVITLLWTCLWTRWSLHSVFLKTIDRFQFQLTRCVGIAVLAILLYIGWIYAIPGTKSFIWARSFGSVYSIW